MVFVYKSDPDRGRRWAEVFAREAPDVEFRIWPDVGDPLRVDVLAAWVPPGCCAAWPPPLRHVADSARRITAGEPAQQLLEGRNSEAQGTEVQVISAAFKLLAQARANV